MKKKVWIGGVVLITVIVIGGFYYYWWYNTPHIVYDESVKTHITFDDTFELVNVRILNISYKSNICMIHQLEFPKDISRDVIISMLNSYAVVRTTKNKSINFGYDGFVATVEQNDMMADVLVLLKNNEAIAFICNQEIGEEIARWFVER